MHAVTFLHALALVLIFLTQKINASFIDHWGAVEYYHITKRYQSFYTIHFRVQLISEIPPINDF